MNVHPMLELGDRAFAQFEQKTLRSMRDFAEQEIIIPDGDFAGQRFRCDRQPFTGLMLKEMDDRTWQRIILVGCRQSGKSLLGFVIVILYHLFEYGESVICGLPSRDMATEKWVKNIRPVIERSQYARHLPDSGAGGHRGNSNLRMIGFKNGTFLTFMSGGGRDKTRAAANSPVLIVTETEGLDETSSTSREGDKISQMEEVTSSFSKSGRRRVYMECTPSTEQGRTWREYTGGSQSRLAIRCPHCGRWVTPERAHLIGWQDAADVQAAKANARFVCPDCGSLWTEADRISANHNCRLVHRGQTISPEGEVLGDRPRTNALGFRWTAVNNLLMPTVDIAEKEWRGKNDPDEANSEKVLSQFLWALPPKPSAINITDLTVEAICTRMSDSPRGYVPDGTKRITLAVDVGKRVCHWTAIAWSGEGPRVIDYGAFSVASDDMPEDRAILLAMRDFRDSVLKDGWESPGGRRFPELVFIDSGYQPDVVYGFCRESGPAFWPSKGFGSTQRDVKKFTQRARSECLLLGEGFQVVRLPAPLDGGPRVMLVEVNSDHWKSKVHMRLRAPANQAGALLLFRAGVAKEHRSFAKHLTNEKQVDEFKAGRGQVIRWVAVHQDNHWLDATALAFAADAACGGAPSSPGGGTETPSTPPPTGAIPPAAGGGAGEGRAGAAGGREGGGVYNFSTAHRGKW